MWPFVKSASYLTAHPCLTSQKPLSICCLSTPCGSLTENKDYSNDHLCLCFSWLGSCGWWRDNFLESVWREKPAHLTGQILRYRTWETLGCHSLLACISQSPSAMRIGTRSSSEVNSSPRIPALPTSCAIEIPFPVCCNVKRKCADYAYMATPTVVGPSPHPSYIPERSQNFTWSVKSVCPSILQNDMVPKEIWRASSTFLKYWPPFAHVGIKASGCQQLQRHFRHALRPINF